MKPRFTNAKLSATIAAMAFSGVLLAGAAQTGPDPGQTAEVAPEAAPAKPLDDTDRALFDAIDEDGDGQITEEELLGYFNEHAEDAEMTASEFAAFLKAEDADEIEAREDRSERERVLFDAIDRDGDGTISREDVVRWFEEHAEDERITEAEFAKFIKSDLGIGLDIQ